MPHILTNGIRTHYKRTPAKDVPPGHAPTAVFIHGLGTDSLASFYLTLAAPLSASGIDVVAYDLRGHGRSDRPEEGYDLDNLAKDLDAVLDQLEISHPVHLVGNSFGGTIAYTYAWRRPERVASLVAIEAEPPTDVWAGKISQLLGFVVEMLDREDTYDWITANRGTHQTRLARLTHQRLKSTRMVAEIPNGPLLDDLGQIQCPVLNIIGSGGYQSDEPLLMESLLPRCRTVVLEGQDHSVLVEAHRTVRELVRDWIGQHDVVTADEGVA
jgi:pimeloyl-ACP methyl ester carboxylesterase